jgi:hypothetical protein
MPKQLLKILCTFSALTLLLIGCASQPPAIDRSSELTAAAEAILGEAAYTNNLFNNCAKLGGDTEVEAISTQQDWLNTNKDSINAADNYYSQQQHLISLNGISLSPHAIRLSQIAHQKATQELGLAQRSASNQHKACQFRLKQISASQYKLNLPAPLAPYVQELRNLAPQNMATPVNLPSLAQNIATNTPPGRSYYSIFKQLEANCPNAYTLVIAHNWPSETYANFCGAQLIETIQCEWGKCDTKKL